jgi:hypothetical protein
MQDGMTYDCVNSDASACEYEQLTGGQFPQIDSFTFTDSTIILTGSNFDLADFEATGTIMGVNADSVVIDSSTQATITFDLGVPIANEVPTMAFTKDSVVHFAEASEALIKAISVYSSSADLVCSFAGGCSY